MTRKTWGQWVTLAVALIVFAVTLEVAAQLASARDGSLVVTPGTACGAPGVGRLVGRAEPVSRSASEAAGTWVNTEGDWATPCPLIATPGTACGAPGVGRMPGFGMLAKDSANAAAGWRVDADGVWQPCDRPCLPAQAEAFRVWSDGAHVCTTYDRYATSGTDPARDRVLRHGELGRWEQWTGAMRGVLHERCDDGQRTRTWATCAVATHCDTRVEATREGRTYVYDARPEAARVPVGQSIDLRAADGVTWPATCVAGSWDVPSVRPRPVVPPRVPHVITACRAQTSPFDVPDLGRRWVSVRALSTSVGQDVMGEVVGTPFRRPIKMRCGADGRFILAPPASPEGGARAGADEWLRLFERYQMIERK